MNEIRFERWRDFTDAAEQLDGWAFRGQSSASWPLMSSLTRRLRAFSPDSTLWPLREERAMRIFRRKAHIYLHDRQVLQDDLRCLALMQHHGAPTRVLDFTKSPFVAAFFGFESTTDQVAVYAVNTPALWSARPRAHPELTRDAIDPRQQPNFQRYFASNRYPVIWFGEPLEMDTRLVAQSGLFMVPGVLDQSFEQILAGYDVDPESLLQKFVLSLEMRDEAMRALYRMNVTHATLFPDLDGLSRSIAYELEVVWPRLVEDFKLNQGRFADPAGTS
jgi:hypothetical protein